MLRCLELALNGKGKTAPNPMVGSVIVHGDAVIGEGYHAEYGGPHAEVNAINSVKDKSLLPESTIYVSLEPCSHTGKTPPCSDLIVQNKLKKVVIGTLDPNSLVSGRGIARLEANGIEVVTGVLQEKLYRLNKRFLTFHRLKRPYIILKWAQSKDGFIDVDRKAGTPIGPNWISNPVSRMLVHKWRSEEQSIMVGTNTVLYDNPKLDTRLWPGESPIRIVTNRSNRLRDDHNVFDGSVPTLVMGEKSYNKPNAEFIRVDENEHQVEQLLHELYKRNIQSVFVEGGGKLIQSFLDLNLWDEARVFQGDNNFVKGIPAPVVRSSRIRHQKILNDNLVVYDNRMLNPYN